MSKTIQILEANAQMAYKEGTASERKLLVNLCGAEVFDPKPLLERILTFEDVCMEAGEDIGDYVFPASGSPGDMLAICAKRNALISRVFNEGHEFKPGDCIYYASHTVVIDSAAPRGFRLSYYVYCYDFGYAFLGARPGLW